MGFCVTLLLQIAAWCWLIEDSQCFFLTYTAFQRLLWNPKVPCRKVKMGVHIIPDKLVPEAIVHGCWEYLGWPLVEGTEEQSG